MTPVSQTMQTLKQRWPYALLVLYLLTGVYVVKTDEQGVVRTLGRAAADPARPGLHYRLPPPFSRLNKVKVYQRKRVSVGFSIADQATGRKPSAAETQFLTGDQNLVNIEMLLQYSIHNPRAYLFRSENPESLIAAAASAALTRLLTSTLVDQVLTIGKVAIQNDVQRITQALIESYGIGVQIDAVTLVRVYPPDEVADAFKDVASARSDAERTINEAQGYAGDVIPRARGEAERLIQEAMAYRDTVINEATGDADRFTKLYEAYVQARDVTSARIYLEAMEEILPKLNKMLVDEGRQPFDLTIMQTNPLAQETPPAPPSSSSSGAGGVVPGP